MVALGPWCLSPDPPECLPALDWDPCRRRRWSRLHRGHERWSLPSGKNFLPTHQATEPWKPCSAAVAHATDARGRQCAAKGLLCCVLQPDRDRCPWLRTSPRPGGSHAVAQSAHWSPFTDFFMRLPYRAFFLTTQPRVLKK